MLKRMTLMLIGFCVATTCRAGTPQKWDDLPRAVRDTVVANGGKAGMTVDKEPGKIDGKAVYEAGIKGKDGNIIDLVITEDGTLIKIKTDDAADKAAERVARAERVLRGVSFSHPRQITNPFLPLATVKQDILMGTEEGKKVRVERTARPEVRKTFQVGKQTVESLAFEDRAYEDGELVEVALDYFAQDDKGTVYYLGEDVDEYKDGKVIGHEGSWLFGKDTPAPGVMIPAQPKLGLKWRSEDVSNDISEVDEIVSLSEKVTTPAGTYDNCLKVKESLADGTTEFKYYAPGVGVVREAPPDGDVRLQTHTTMSAK